MQGVRLGFADGPMGIHEASAAAVARVLEAHDLEVEFVPLAAEQVEATLEGEGVDLFAAAWIGADEAAGPALGVMQPLGLLYEPCLLWSMLPGTVTSIDALAQAAEVARRIPAGPLLVEASRRAARLYGLEEAGFTVEAVSEQEAWNWASEARAGHVVPLCRPHPFLFEGRLQALADPRAALGGARQARLLIRPAAREALDPDLIDELEALLLDSRVVSAMARAMREGGMSAEEAADAWQRGRLTPRG